MATSLNELYIHDTFEMCSRTIKLAIIIGRKTGKILNPSTNVDNLRIRMK